MIQGYHDLFFIEHVSGKYATIYDGPMETIGDEGKPTETLHQHKQKKFLTNSTKVN